LDFYLLCLKITSTSFITTSNAVCDSTYVPAKIRR